MDFTRYRDNLTSQLAKINSDIVDHEDSLSQLKELRARVSWWIRGVRSIEKDTPEEKPTVTRGTAATIQGQIQKRY
ncbi:MAG: hypothetical protein CM15mV5_0190 [uncultured marine virus]|nr:MAG: hypothetical protein CM15mV5_0190 [uncultured marine virus]